MVIKRLAKSRVLLLSLVILFWGSIISDNAFAYVPTYCTDDTRYCTMVTLERSDQIGYSYGMWVPAGTEIYYQFDTTNSTHGVGFGIEQESTGQIIASRTAAAGSNGNWDFVTVSQSGYYRLKAQCGGTGQTGCSGVGRMDFPK